MSRRKRRLTPYFIHNIDGIYEGVIWAHSKRDVARLLRMSEIEIRAADRNEPPQIKAGVEAAKAEPGRIYQHPVIGSRLPKEWTRRWGAAVNIDPGATP